MLFKRFVSVTCAGLLAGCALGISAAAASAATPTLNGAGSTLVAPIEAEWAAVWDTSTSSLVNYSPVGSGSGEKAIAASAGEGDGRKNYIKQQVKLLEEPK